ncbi:DUF4251 domain-containing protein [Dokdonia ponticola]|uniref:DUF4251 domain-containing protein n=1 Tax=Dokdonia ponticola TaxID=2041041 RepID=A0ABV9I3T9_9FLAO
MKTRILICLLLFSFSQISFSQSRSERKALKKEMDTKAYEQTKALLDNGTFFFNAEWMLPRDGTQVLLINNPGFIKFYDAAKIDMYLPYFGIIRIGGGLNQPAAIQHKGEISSFKITHNDTKRVSIISFTASGTIEQYDVTIKVYSNNTATMFVNSTKRDGIRYRGVVTTLEEALSTEK